MDDLRSMLPRTKYDLERAEAIAAIGYPGVAPVLPELLEWMKDMNWPVAKIIAPFLATIGAPLAPFVREIFSTDDAIWKEWILGNLIEESPALFDAVQSDVRRIAFGATHNEDEESLRNAALELLSSIRRSTAEKPTTSDFDPNLAEHKDGW